MNILVRVDVSAKIGLGHYWRMKNLSFKMSSHNFFFLVKTDCKMNIEDDISYIIIKHNQNEIELIEKTIKTQDIEIIIIDLLHYQKGYIKRLKSINSSVIVTFHEYDDYSDYSDIKINYNLFNGWKKVNKKNFLSGPKYIILNRDLFNVQAENNGYVFVSFGGSDPNNIMLSFIEIIINKSQNINYIIHIGPLNNNWKLINRMLKNKDCKIFSNPQNIYELMGRSSINILAGGNMMYESIFLKKQTFIIAQNEHQKEFALNAQEEGLIKYFGIFPKIKWENLTMEINDPIPNNILKEESVIDGKGCDRIVSKIEEFLNENYIY